MVTSARKRPQIGKPKIQGFMARSTQKLVLLYQRRRNETFVLLYTYGDGRGRSRNKLQVGARFSGRFYPSRCDLSPDAKHFVYFVMGGAQKGYKKRHYCWTAMSRPPALTALFLLPHDDTWGSGGCFLDNGQVLIEGGLYDEVEKLLALHGKCFDGVKVRVRSAYVGLNEDDALQAPQPDGWVPVNPVRRLLSSGTFEKRAKRTKLVIREHDDVARRGDYDRWLYTLLDDRGRAVLPEELMETVTWADFDLQGRLMMGVGSQLHIYNKPRGGMAARPNRTIDLEAETEPDGR